MKKKELTKYEKECAARLKSLWLRMKEKTGLTQEDAKLALGFKSQSAVSHYLNGRIPLSTNAKIKFSRFFQCEVTDFDPEFHAKDSNAMIIQDSQLTMVQRKWLIALDQLDVPVQIKLVDLAESIVKINNKQSK